MEYQKVNDLRKSYDNHGNLINEVAYKNGKVDKNNSFYYELTYDKFNNWTVRKRFNLDGKKISELTKKNNVLLVKTSDNIINNRKKRVLFKHSFYTY